MKELKRKSVKKCDNILIHPFVEEALQSIEHYLPLIDPPRLKEAINFLSKVIWHMSNTSHFNLARMRSYDIQTHIHSINVALFSILISLQLGFSKSFIREVAIGGFFHDWGKLLVPKHILDKPESLTVEEFEVIKKHPINGERMLQRTRVSEDVLKTIRQHHERWRGQGYPDSLYKYDIHLQAQIVAIADVFEALTADRPYRNGMHPYHALEMIFLEEDINFSSKLVHSFRSALLLYFNYPVVRLNTGEIGLVMAVPLRLLTRPLVKVLYDEKGRGLKNEKLIDLSQELTYFVDKYINTTDIVPMGRIILR
ncbi:HD-GYP domain-containing protein [Desulfitobacterium sp. Sab5]|uniref:HD-GYP domain-containing protein n=1 Tax=Desulfitobacterium nosdiversum TaxID=3375356 RepID=UPI003CF10D9A